MGQTPAVRCYGFSCPAAPCGLPQRVELLNAVASPFAPPAKLLSLPNAPNAPWPAHGVWAADCSQPFADAPQYTPLWPPGSLNPAAGNASAAAVAASTVSLFMFSPFVCRCRLRYAPGLTKQNGPEGPLCEGGIRGRWYARGIDYVSVPSLPLKGEP